MLAALALCLALAQGSDPTLDVFIVDDQGSLLTEGWRVRLNSRPSQLGSRTSTQVDPETGRARFFELDGLVYVQGSHRSGEETPWERVRLAKDGPTVHELALGGPAPARSLFVEVTTASGSALPDELIARNAAGELVATLTPVRDGKFAARGVPSGVYRIETVDPRFEPLVLAEHPTGEPASVTLVGSASLTVRFVDAVDRTPVAASAARLSLSSRDGIRVRTVTRPLQVGPAAQPVVIEAGLGIEVNAGFETHEAIRHELDPLAPGEHREIVVDVPRGLELRGSLCDPSGAPLTGVVVRSTLATASPVQGVATSTKVVLYHRSIGGPPYSQADRDKVAEAAKNMTTSALSPSFRDAPRVARTDGLGTFELRGLSTAPSELFVCFTPWHVEAVKVEHASDLGVLTVAPEHRGAADLVLALGDPSRFEFALQIGDGPWLGPEAAKTAVTDDGQRITLRGLPQVTCRLRVVPLARTTRGTDPGAWVVEFVPAVDTPTTVTVAPPSPTR